MKQLLLLAAAITLACSPVSAVTKLAKAGPWDNWYVGLNVGFNSKLTHNPFMSHLNPHLSLRAGHDFLPVVGVMVEITPFFNDQRFPASKIGALNIYSHTGIKAIDFDLLGDVNLSNLFRGYPGSPRFFETHLIAGVGLNHVCGISTGKKNDLISKVGLDFAFHLDPEGAWEGYVEPPLNYNLTRYSDHVAFNPNYAAWQLAVGVNYHFRNRDGRRHFRYRSTEDIVHEEIVLLTKETAEKEQASRPAVNVRTLDTSAATAQTNKQKANEPTGIDHLFDEEEQAILSEPEKPVQAAKSTAKPVQAKKPTIRPVQATTTQPAAAKAETKKAVQPSNTAANNMASSRLMVASRRMAVDSNMAANRHMVLSSNMQGSKDTQNSRLMFLLIWSAIYIDVAHVVLRFLSTMLKPRHFVYTVEIPMLYFPELQR